MSIAGAIDSGREAKLAPRPRNLVARMTAPLLAAMAGRYDDTYIRDGVAAATPRTGVTKILADLVADIARKAREMWAWTRDKVQNAGSWIAQKAAAITQWVVAAVAKAFSIFTRTKVEEEKRQAEEAAYQKKLQERKAAERQDETRRAEQASLERAAQARRQAASDAAAVVALATDQIKAPPPGAERHQLVDNATLERRRAFKKVLTGMLPA